MANVTLLTGGSVPKGLESPMKERKVIRIIDIVRKENSMSRSDCPYYDENASVCDDGDCGCCECYRRIEKLKAQKGE